MNKKKAEELSWAEVKAMFAENERRWAASCAEADERWAKSCAEADKRRAEADERWAASCAEADKRRAEADERRKEIDKLQKETAKQMKETDERLKKLGEEIGGVSNNAGYHAEQFFQDAFAETKTFGGEKYDKIIKNFCHEDKNVGRLEIDILLINGKSVAIIEVKSRIHPNFVGEMASERIAKFRKLFPEYKGHKAYLGIAGFSFCDTVCNEAKKHGIGLIKQIGNSVEITAEHLKAY